MAQIAFIAGDNFLYWKDILLILAAASFVFTFLALYWGHGGKFEAGIVTVCMALGLSMVLSRLVHWYSSPDSYPDLLSVAGSGGYQLIGCFLGCPMAVLLGKAMGLHDHTGKMLDHMCLAGSLAISLGRLASLFDGTCRGQILENTLLPWVYPVENVVSGAVEYRFATFLVQSQIAGLLFFALLYAYVKRPEKSVDGETAEVFLLCYSASQIVLDSTRYDSAYFHFNGFVSIVQVACAVTLVAIIVRASIGRIRRKQVRTVDFGIWACIAGLIGLAGYMEYYVQRHGNLALYAYSVMSLSLLGIVLLTMTLRKGDRNYDGLFSKQRGD